MAQVRSGSFNTTGYQGRCLTFLWELTGQSIEGNYSTISWQVVGAGGDSRYYYETNNTKVNVAGNIVYTQSSKINLLVGTIVAQGTSAISHDSSGNATFSAYVEAGIYYYAVNCSGSGTWELPTIPRQANIVSAPNFNDEENPTITYSNPAGNSLTTLQACISFDGSKDDIIYRDIPKTGTSYTFNLTNAEREVLRKGCTTAKSRNVIFYVTSLIGGTNFYSTLARTLTITNATPTVGTLTYKDTNDATKQITENDQRIIRGNSNLLFTIGSATAKKSASISKYEITFNGTTKSRTNAGTLDFGMINLSNNGTATLTVTDSRGYTTKKTMTVIVDDWTLPTGLISIQRKNNFYSETYLKVDGTYSSLNGKNSMGIDYEIVKEGEKTASYFGSLEDNVQKTLDLDNNYQWYITIRILDRIGQATYYLTLDRGMPLIYFDRHRNSIGVNCFPNSAKSIYLNGNKLSDGVAVYEAGNIDPNTTLDELILTKHENNPYGTSVFAYIHTMFYSKKSEASHRTQIAYPYNSHLGIYQRYYNSGNWSEWREVGTPKKVLYENASGTYTNITLNDTLANYKYYEIIFTLGGSQYSTGKLSARNGYPYLVANANVYENGAYYLKTQSELLVISGKTITRQEAYVSKVQINGQVAVGSTASGTNLVYITQVIGYN